MVAYNGLYPHKLVVCITVIVKGFFSGSFVFPLFSKRNMRKFRRIWAWTTAFFNCKTIKF